MPTLKKTLNTAQTVRRRIASNRDRLWGYRDFADLPPAASAQALSRLNKQGVIVKYGKGLYYAPRATPFGQSVPTGPDVAAYLAQGTIHPSGVSAASVLGLTTQNAARREFATTRTSRPVAFGRAHVATDRPKSRIGLSAVEGAILETLRARARSSDLDARATQTRLIQILRDPRVFRRVAKAALDEPPRARAILGALGQQVGAPDSVLKPLKASLNPLSKFDFGPFASMPYARDWQSR